MKTIIAIMFMSVVANAVEPPTNRDVRQVIDIVGAILNKNKKPKPDKPKAVDIDKVVLTRDQIDKLIQSAMEKGRREGFKEGYRQGYIDGINKRDKNEKEIRNNQNQNKR